MSTIFKRYIFISICLCMLIGQAVANTADLPVPEFLENSKQLIVVVTDTWGTPHAQMQNFVRSSVNEPWYAKGPAWDVVVGKNGLGWAADLSQYSLSGPVKKEGDKKAPAGAFKIGNAFGFAATKDPAVKLSYVPITTSVVCVDDSNSKYYGQVIDSTQVAKKDWNSSEIMSDYKQAYHQGMILDYNTAGKIPNGGSCIFLHIMSDLDAYGTFGCTAMPKERLAQLLQWLNPKKDPVVVQLPKAEYQTLEKAWHLPKISSAAS